jgi:hypothetical protein
LRDASGSPMRHHRQQAVPIASGVRGDPPGIVIHVAK